MLPGASPSGGKGGTAPPVPEVEPAPAQRQSVLPRGLPTAPVGLVPSKLPARLTVAQAPLWRGHEIILCRKARGGLAAVAPAPGLRHTAPFPLGPRGLGTARPQEARRDWRAADSPGSNSSSWKREQRPWYSQLLRGLAAGSGPQHTLSLMPARAQGGRVTAAGAAGRGRAPGGWGLPHRPPCPLSPCHPGFHHSSRW